MDRAPDGPSSARSGPPPDRWLGVAFVAVLAGYVLLILALPYFATVDGPSHVGAAAALWDALLRDGDVVERYASVHLLPLSNVIPDVPMGLLALAIGAQLSEKLVIAGAAIGLPLGVVYAVRGVDAARWWLAFAALPLSFTFALHYGFYPFCYGLVGFVLVAGLVVRHRDGWSVRAAVGLALLLTATFVAHVLPFLLALGYMATVAAMDGLLSWRSRSGTVIRRWLPALAAAVPGIVLTATLVVVGLSDERTDLVRDGTVIGEGSSSLVKLAGTLSLAWGTVTYDTREAIVTAGLAGMLLVLSLLALRWRLWPDGQLRRPTIRRDDASLAFAILLVLAVAILPTGANFAAGGSHLGQRLAPLPAIMLLLWLAAQDLSVGRPGLAPWIPRTVAVVSIIASGALVAVRLPAYTVLSDHLVGLEAMTSCVREDATMIQANLGQVRPGSLDRTWPLSGETGRLTADTDGWDLGTIGAALPFFQLRNLEATDPYRYLTPDGFLQATPPTIDPRAYAAATPGEVDYVLVAGRPVAEPETLASPSWRHLEAQLGEDFVLLATSPDGVFELYESRALADDPPPTDAGVCPQPAP